MDMNELLSDLGEVMEDTTPALVDLEPVQTPEPSPSPVSTPSSTSLPSDPVSEQPTIVQEVTEVQFPSYLVDMGDGLYYLTDTPPVSAAPLSVGSVYPATIQSTASDYFAGVVAQNPGVDYVAFRDSEDSSVLFYGDGLDYSNGRFSGTADYVRYTFAGYNQYSISRGTDTVNISDSGFIYSNMDASFACYPDGEVASYGAVLSLSLCVCIGLWILGRIFFRRCG